MEKDKYTVLLDELAEALKNKNETILLQACEIERLKQVIRDAKSINEITCAQPQKIEKRNGREE